MWSRYQLSAIRPAAAIAWIDRCDPNRSATPSARAIVATASPPAASRNSGSGGIDSYPK
jgi:hypothetical protein